MKLKVLIILILLISILLLCTACYQSQEVEGTVVDKTIRAAYTTVVPVHVGKIMTMTVHYHPTDYRLIVELEDGTQAIKSVSQEVFDQTEIGDKTMVSILVKKS